MSAPAQVLSPLCSGALPLNVIVKIPCYNAEQRLPETVADIPRHSDGIDDGSRNRTIKVPREIGVDHTIGNKRNAGLARTFRKGVDACLVRGADIIVNTDGDNQYSGADIAKLVQPIIEGRADMVIGDRETSKIPHFSPIKKVLQYLGSGVVRRLAGIWVPDTVSGFRAFSREAAMRINVVSSFSYTIETVIQAGKRQLAVESVPIRTNPKTRDSRLFKSIPHFIQNSLGTMVRMYAMYQPLRVFFYLGAVMVIIGLLPILRFLYFYFTSGGAGHIQSLLLGSVLVILGFITFLIGLLADLISFNRQLLEMTLERVKRLELDHFRTDATLGSDAVRRDD